MSREPARWGTAVLREGGPPVDAALPATEPLREHAVTGVGYAPVGEVADAAPVRELLRAAALCSNARLVPPAGRDGWRVLGDTTEGALLVAAMK